MDNRAVDGFGANTGVVGTLNSMLPVVRPSFKTPGLPVRIVIGIHLGGSVVTIAWLAHIIPPTAIPAAPVISSQRPTQRQPQPSGQNLSASTAGVGNDEDEA